MDQDLGLLLVRLALGPMLVMHGLNKIFGPGGLDGTAGWFEALGLRWPRLQARLAAGSEVTAGTLLILGLLTPFAATVFVALMAVAAVTDHRGKGYFVFKGGWEYVLVVAMAATAVASAGPGSISVDAALGWDLAGWASGLGAAAIGVVAAAAHLTVSRSRIA